ncbi:hypothetical protein DFQ27_007603 [Actinomortierella ambigua]|uniref:Uncharacterized protein n=1 Tax=Actinomortierella ambigua TaxID=1343610 RepID=A0A9P6PTE5_9FUNG|nr:hypothetical protein DFQ27_007603 [Actinomortierella ambigua]
MSNNRASFPSSSSSSSSSSSTMNPDAAGRQGSKKGLSSDDVKAIKEEVLMALQAAKPAYSRELLATEVANYITQQPANKLLGMLKDDPIITDIVDEIAMLQEEAGEERAQGKALAARVARMEELMEGRARAVAVAQAPVPPQLAELARRVSALENKLERYFS